MQSLINDTISYLRQEGHLTTKQARKKAPAPKPVLKKQETLKAPTTAEEVPPPPPQKQEPTPLGFQTIQKHLPHLKLIEAIPTPKTIAILVSDESELPFLQGLARAIQDKLCPVKLLPSTANLAPYSFVLTQTPQKKEHIQLLHSSVYNSDPKQKKALWMHLCQLLKSS